MIVLIILNCNFVFAEETDCSYFYKKLSKLPHTKLTLSRDVLISFWDGKKIPGCEIIFESDESIVPGDKVYNIFQSFIHAQGWVINNKLIADGPGSSTVDIESDKSKCGIHGAQQSWIDEETLKHMQNSHIEMIIQCSSK